MTTRINVAAAACFSLLTLGLTGCPQMGLTLGPFAIPIPVSPYLQKYPEDKFWNHLRYDRTPILGPITPGGPTEAIDPPSDDEVMRQMEKSRPVQGGTPFLQEKQRNNVRIVKDKIQDVLDPPRVLPLVGPVQVHHSHWKCTVYFTEITRVGYPFPHTLTDEECIEVVYIDHDHLHTVGNADGGPSSNYQGSSPLH